MRLPVPAPLSSFAIPFGCAAFLMLSSVAPSFGQVAKPGEKYGQAMLPSATFINTNSKGKTKMFEFSGITSVGDQLIVIDNETGRLGKNNAGIDDRFDQALFEVVFADGGELKVKRAWSESFADIASFDDLEGITARERFVYLMGSHSTDNEDTYRPERHVFLRVTLGENGEPVRGSQAEVFSDLSDALLGWAKAAGLKTAEIKGKKGKNNRVFIKNFDIEGLAAIPGDTGLLLALRGPLHNKAGNESAHAFILHFKNPDAVFAKKGVKPELTTFATLHLKGQGISSMEFDPRSNSLLIASTDKNEKDPVISRLWQWRLPLKSAEPTIIETFTGKKLEGVARIPKGHKYEDCLLLAFDEESKEGDAKQFGRLEVMRWLPPSPAR